jgi:hypothetical protein
MRKLFIANIFKLKAPKSIFSDSYRAFIISTYIYYLCIAIHIGLLALFYVIKVYPMVIFNIFSINLFIITIFLNYKGKLSLAYNLGATEILVHACLATIFIGWNSNFPVYTISLLFVNILASNETALRRLLLSVFTMLANVAVFAYCALFSPIYVVNKILLAVVGTINLATICVTIILVCYKYYTTTEKLKMDLIERNKLISERNERILESITYAKIIQLAILPREDIIQNYLTDYFIFWSPKDIVGGDIY